MDSEVLRALTTGKVILASQSPRRLQILKENLGVDRIAVLPSKFDEDFDKSQYSPFEYVMATASQKALDVYKSEVDADIPPTMVLSADTIVLVDGVIAEKPRDQAHNLQMLKRLRDSAHPHKIITAVCCIVPYDVPVAPGYAFESQLEEVTVQFDKNLSDEALEAYVRSGQGLEAAGGYMIQSRGAAFVDYIKGDFYCAMGLPVGATIKLIKRALQTSRQASGSDSESD